MQKARTRVLGEFGELLIGLDMVEFGWQHKFGLICSLISLGLATIVHLPAVYILEDATSPLICLFFPGLEDPTAR